MITIGILEDVSSLLFFLNYICIYDVCQKKKHMFHDGLDHNC